MKSSALAIGDVAARFGLAPHVLRHWESVGLLAPDRVAGRRRYSDDDLYRVAAILRAKDAGLSLDRIQRMIGGGGRPRRAAVLREQRDELRTRIAAAQRALDLVECALRCRHDDITSCPSYRRLTGRG